MKKRRHQSTRFHSATPSKSLRLLGAFLTTLSSSWIVVSVLSTLKTARKKTTESSTSKKYRERLSTACLEEPTLWWRKTSLSFWFWRDQSARSTSCCCRSILECCSTTSDKNSRSTCSTKRTRLSSPCCPTNWFKSLNRQRCWMLATSAMKTTRNCWSTSKTQRVKTVPPWLTPASSSRTTFSFWRPRETFQTLTYLSRGRTPLYCTRRKMGPSFRFHFGPSSWSSATKTAVSRSTSCTTCLSLNRQRMFWQASCLSNRSNRWQISCVTKSKRFSCLQRCLAKSSLAKSWSSQNLLLSIKRESNTRLKSIRRRKTSWQGQPIMPEVELHHLKQSAPKKRKRQTIWNRRQHGRPSQPRLRSSKREWCK